MMVTVGNKRYVEVLQSFVDPYNETPHKTLGFVAPNNVTENNKEEIRRLCLKEDAVKGRFYPWQLQSVNYTEDELVHVQELDRKRGKVLVHYVGWDKKFDEWVTTRKFNGMIKNVA
ncbi:hypothetical protein RvY_02348 [Ramazzottius varieornatus]|uniref:Tudor-knot domain-containing protein n=1 Tax=Ramazzottius varieornatus TaxID=947166 RepID=A0A1D1UJG2_RAMVA|nr:hypothetical protein RvY_02348 [Ramazzottius varieornatus]